MNPHQTVPQCRGFTLMELMVVLVLMGIILSMTTLTGGSGEPSRELQEEAQRLVTLIRMARDEAIIRAEDWDVVFYEDSYKFQRLKRVVGDKVDNKGKLILEVADVNNKVFRKRTLSGYKLSVLLDDSINRFGHVDAGEEDEVSLARIQISPSGEITPFELNIHLELLDDYFVITGNEFGDLTLKNSKEL